jgi:hypothetical protein
VQREVYELERSENARAMAVLAHCSKQLLTEARLLEFRGAQQ